MKPSNTSPFSVKETCPRCGYEFSTLAHLTEVICPKCRRVVYSLECRDCQNRITALSRRKITCDECGSDAMSLTTFSGRAALRDAYVVDGAGWAPEVGSEIGFELASDAFLFGPEPYRGPVERIPATALTDIQINGQSETTGGNFWGGGFGLAGAAIGMATATALNALTTSHQSWVIVTVTGTGGFVTLRLEGTKEEQLRKMFRPLRDSIVGQLVQPPHSEKAPPPDPLLDFLERLARMHDAGHLTDDEFRIAKRRLLE